MSNRMKVRGLPDGRFLDAWEVAWDKNILELSIPDAQTEFRPGAAAEIETESMLYLGEIRHSSGPSLTVCVEHSLDRSRLASLQLMWQ